MLITLGELDIHGFVVFGDPLVAGCLISMLPGMHRCGIAAKLSVDVCVRVVCFCRGIRKVVFGLCCEPSQPDNGRCSWSAESWPRN